MICFEKPRVPFNERIRKPNAPSVENIERPTNEPCLDALSTRC